MVSLSDAAAEDEDPERWGLRHASEQVGPDAVVRRRRRPRTMGIETHGLLVFEGAPQAAEDEDPERWGLRRGGIEPGEHSRAPRRRRRPRTMGIETTSVVSLSDAAPACRRRRPRTMGIETRRPTRPRPAGPGGRRRRPRTMGIETRPRWALMRAYLRSPKTKTPNDGD